MCASKACTSSAPAAAAPTAAPDPRSPFEALAYTVPQSHLDGLILTKLDGTAKGGIITAICEETGVPVRYIGIGEDVEDLRPFDPDEFSRALF